MNPRRSMIHERDRERKRGGEEAKTRQA